MDEFAHSWCGAILLFFWKANKQSNPYISSFQHNLMHVLIWQYLKKPIRLSEWETSCHPWYDEIVDKILQIPPGGIIVTCHGRELAGMCSFNKLLIRKSQVGGWPPFALEETFGRWKLFCFCQIAVSIGNFYCITVVNLLVNGSGTWLLNITDMQGLLSWYRTLSAD